jgi:hypothetical protein
MGKSKFVHRFRVAILPTLVDSFPAFVTSLGSQSHLATVTAKSIDPGGRLPNITSLPKLE